MTYPIAIDDVPICKTTPVQRHTLKYGGHRTVFRKWRWEWRWRWWWRWRWSGLVDGAPLRERASTHRVCGRWQRVSTCAWGRCRAWALASSCATCCNILDCCQRSRAGASKPPRGHFQCVMRGRESPGGVLRAALASRRGISAPFYRGCPDARQFTRAC